MSSSDPWRLFLPARTLSYIHAFISWYALGESTIANLGEGLDRLVDILQAIDPRLHCLEHFCLNARVPIGVPRVVESLEDLRQKEMDQRYHSLRAGK